ncbi:MAG: hypothetical protein OQK78_10880 [Gammaproteobacteria bacterium]|nr:hypothetical protein [Gammaproteobacteria bacterium]
MMPVYLKNSFRVDKYAMRYSDFVPRLFNFCLSLGMSPNHIMPSRAFCSDENQGYPIILITKHFGTFPFNHGRVGGIVATDRHAPHAHHGQDMVIIQASHVGYEPETEEFGIYRRLETENHQHSTDCGAICGVLDWYQNEYNFAREHIKLGRNGDELIVIIDNQLVNDERAEGIFLNLDKIIDMPNGSPEPLQFLSTAKVFYAADELKRRMGEQWPRNHRSIGSHLDSDLFYFRRDLDAITDAGQIINRNLIKSMPNILASKYPSLTAAQANAQVEFDRTFRSIVTEKAYRGKWVVFISGINIDISPREGQSFPLTKYVPWAAYVQNDSGQGYTLEQDELFHILNRHPTENPHKIDLTEVIGSMKREAEIQLHVDEE